MDNSAQIQPRPQSGKKYLLLLGASILFLIITIIYLISQKKEVIVTPPIPQPSIPSIPTITPLPPGARVEDQIIIKFKPGVPEETINNTLKKYNATIIKRIDAIRRLVIQVPQGQEDAILSEMKKDNLIEDAEPDYINQILFTPNDPSLNIQWGLANTGQSVEGKAGKVHADINVQPAWDVTRGTNGVKIAILDTGIDLKHPDLSSKIIVQKDFTGGTSAQDKFGHGTHVAGIASASTHNSAGIAGVCPECKLIVGKVLNDYGNGSDSDVVEGIIWAADQGAKIINLSLGAPSASFSKQDSVNYAWSKGAVIVAAAGNSGHEGNPVFYPAADNNVVSVAATDNQDTKAYFSQYGTWVDLAAPGKSIYSTLPMNPFNFQFFKPGLKTEYDYLEGTSMASPAVAGVAGLIWATSYGTSNSSVVKRLFDTADKISGTGQYWTYGRVNAGRAVASGASVTPTAANTPIPTPIQPTPTGSAPNTPTPVSQPTPTTISSPTPVYATPTWWCIGSCPTPSPTPTPWVPSEYPLPSLYPIITGIYPSSINIPTFGLPTIVVPTIVLPTNIIPAPPQPPYQDIWDLLMEFIRGILGPI